MIDLRSDTVTRPSPAMRAAMMTAEVGDDVWGDDPTVLALQEAVAERAGTEAGLLLPSGTQSNLVALLAHCERGEEYLVGQRAHTYRYEGGGAAVLGSIQPQPIEHEPDGSLALERISAAIKPIDDHFARTRLLALENTLDGQVLDPDYLTAATELAHRAGLATHLDGARLFNAAVASGRPLAELCAGFDTVSLCFSKGLGAPVGSVLVGPAAVISRARRWRKTLGGAMRQAGILAAACRYALDHHVERLAQDHENAARLAAGLAEVAGVAGVRHQTNMVFVELPAEQVGPLGDWLAERGVRVALGPVSRLVTHLDVDKAGIDEVVAAVRAYFAAR